jgi:HlyD family secretion protein
LFLFVRESRPVLAIHAAALAVVLQTWPVRLVRDAPDVLVVSAPATSASVPRTLLAAGTVRPTASISVGTTLTGMIESVEARENSVVHAGQVLARLDAAPYETALAAAHAGFAQTQADLRNDQAAMEQAEREQIRSIQFAAPEPFAQGEPDSAEADVERLRAAIAADESRLNDAYAAVNVAMMNLQLTAIRSPVDGIVLSIDPGAAKTAGTAGPLPGLFRIAVDLSHMEVQAALSEYDTAAVRAGDAAIVTCEGHEIAGTVTDVRNRSLDTATDRASALAVVDVSNPDGVLRPGMLVAVKLTSAEPATIVRVPNGALSFRPQPGLLNAIGEQRVPFFPAPESAGAPLSEVWEFNGTEFTAVGVRTGPDDGDSTEVVAGPIRPGDRLVTSASLPTAAHQ